MRYWIIVFLAAAALQSCQSPGPTKDPLEDIKKLEAELRALDYLDTNIAADLAVAYSSYIEDEGNDSLRPYYNYKLAELYRHWPGMESEAIQALREVEETYTYHEVAPRAILNLGLFYEEQGQKDRAVAAYQEFIDRFPSHKLASQARSLQEMLLNETVTDIQRVQEWKKNSVNK